jgi:excisionase family DNA binding protein
MDDDWLSTEDAAREIGCVSARWVRRQVELGRLRARVLLSGRPTYRIRRSDLDAFLAEFVIEDSRDRDAADD